MKSEKGITLVVLMITLIIMVMLLGVGVAYGTGTYSEVKLQSFSYELQQIQGRVDTFHEKMSMENQPSYVSLNGEILGENIGYSDKALETLKTSKGINYLSSDLQSNQALYDSLYFKQKEGSQTHAYSYYRYFSANALTKFLDIKNAKHDMIINFKTREVISVNRTKL